MSIENTEEHASRTPDDCGTYTAPCGCVVVQRTLEVSPCPVAAGLEQHYWIAQCLAPDCRESYLWPLDLGPCLWCDGSEVAYEPDRTPRNLTAQEETVSALWAFARANGTEPDLDSVSAALTRIMAAFGLEVTAIQ